MYRTLTIVLKPTEEQEKQFYNYIGASRFVWNKLLDEQRARLEKNQCILGVFDLGKRIVDMKYEPDTSWLGEIAHHTLLSVARNMSVAFRQYFAGKNGFPRYKSRKHCTLSFYSRPDRFRIMEGFVHLDKLGIVAFSNRLKWFTKLKSAKVYRVTVQYRKNKWIALISFAYESQVSSPKSGSMGIDVGVHSLVTAYLDGKKAQYPSMLVNMKYRRANKRLDWLNHRLSGKLKFHKYEEPYSKRLQRYLDLVRRAYLRQKFRRRNYIYAIVAQLLAHCPSRVVMETLDVHDMQEAPETSKYTFEASLALCIEAFRAGCEWRGIPFVQADAMFPSSQLCSSCGNRQKLSLADRVYHCPVCGLELDRDVNAAKTYQIGISLSRLLLMGRGCTLECRYLYEATSKQS